MNCENCGGMGHIWNNEKQEAETCLKCHGAGKIPSAIDEVGPGAGDDGGVGQ